MNCREAQERITDLLDANAPPVDPSLCAHLEACPVCSTTVAELKKTLEAFPAITVAASPGFTEATMNAIQDPMFHHPRKPFSMWRAGLAAAAALAVCVGASFGVWYVKNGGAQPIAAYAFMGEAAHAMARVQTLHIQAEMRTPPRDNFDLIVISHDLVPIELWADFREPLRLRVEKPGRVVVSDGGTSTLLIEPKLASTATGSASFIGWLVSLLDVESLLDNETALAREEGSRIALATEISEDGLKEEVLRVEARAKGDFTNDWLKNSSIAASDNLRIYRFDPATKLLKGLEIYVHDPNGDVLAFRTTHVSYDEPVDEDVFALDIPENAVWAVEPQRLVNNAEYERLTPREAAANFFEACSRDDWDEMLKYWSTSDVEERIKNYLGGLSVIDLGTPFQSGQYPGWFVPYEIRLKTGGIKKFNLAVRNDNPANRYVVDGGI